jgi:hypothetical protein
LTKEKININTWIKHNNTSLEVRKKPSRILKNKKDHAEFGETRRINNIGLEVRKKSNRNWEKQEGWRRILRNKKDHF